MDKKTDRVTLRGIISFGFPYLPFAPEIYADLRVQRVMNWIMRKTNNCNNKTCLRDRKCMTGAKLNPYTKKRFYQDGPFRRFKKTSEESTSEESSQKDSSGFWS